MQQQVDIIEQFKKLLPILMNELPNWQAMATVLGEQLQAIEDANWQFYSGQLSFVGAPSYLLDKIGAGMGVAREGLDDTAFALVLDTYLLAFRSSGEEWRLAEIARRLLGGVSATARSYGRQACSIQVAVTTAPTEAQKNRALRVIDLAAAGGVLARPVSWYLNDQAVKFSDCPDAIGWGGYFAEAI